MINKLRIFTRRTGALMRKDIKVSARSVIPMLLLIAAMALGCVLLCLSVISGAQKKEELVAIGIVDKDKTMISKLAIGMVSANEEVASMFTVRNYDSEEEAYEAVRDGVTVAAIVFEKDYFYKILDGESSAVSVMLSRTIEMHSQLIRDFAHTGEILIKTGEYGVNAAWKPMKEASPSYDSAVWKFNVFSLEYAVEVLALTGSSVDGVVLPYSTSSSSLSGHYMLHYSVLLLSLVDMLYFDFVRRDCNRTLLSRFKSAGVGGMHIIVSKLPSVLLTKAVLLVVMLAVLSGLFSVSVSIVSVLSIVCFLLFSSIFGVCLCALTQISDIGPCIICALCFAGLFLCGGLVPYDMLPVSVTALGAYTHIGVGVSMLAPAFGGNVFPLSYISAFLYAAAMLYLSKRRFDSLCIEGGEGA